MNECQKNEKLPADVSKNRIGAVLLHKLRDGSIKSIAHALRMLLAAEKNYSQIEKEGLAIIFAMKKFHRYIYGQSFILQTDHKPLLSIFCIKEGPTNLFREQVVKMEYPFTKL